VQRLEAGQSPAAGREVLDPTTRAVEEIMLEVRMAGGIDIAGLTSEQRVELDRVVADGLGDVVGGRFRLTRPGRLLADAVVRRLVP
jgi:oxygen-independent coproporphyrinogen-3 oxidase